MPASNNLPTVGISSLERRNLESATVSLFTRWGNQLLVVVYSQRSYRDNQLIILTLIVELCYVLDGIIVFKVSGPAVI